MEFRDIPPLVRKIKIRAGGALWRPELTIKPQMEGGAIFRVLKLVPERSIEHIDHSSIEKLAPQMATICSDYFLGKVEIVAATEATMVKRLLFFVRDSLIHEVDESIWFDGRLARDKHLGDVPR